MGCNFEVSIRMIQSMKSCLPLHFKTWGFTTHLWNMWLSFPCFYCLLTANGFSSFRVRYSTSCHVDLRHIFSGQSQLKTNGNKSKTEKRRKRKRRKEEKEEGVRRRRKKSLELFLSLSEFSHLQNFSHL